MIRLTAGSRYRAYPQISLLTCWLSFDQVELVPFLLKSMIAGNISDQTMARRSSEAGNDQLNEAASKRVPAQYAAGPPRPPNRAASSSLFLSHARLWWIVMASPNQIISSQKGMGKLGLHVVKKIPKVTIASGGRVEKSIIMIQMIKLLEKQPEIRQISRGKIVCQGRW